MLVRSGPVRSANILTVPCHVPVLVQDNCSFSAPHFPMASPKFTYITDNTLRPCYKDQPLNRKTMVNCCGRELPQTHRNTHPVHIVTILL